MKKILSMLLAAVMLISTAAVSFSAQAYNAAKCLSVSISGRYVMENIEAALNTVNAARVENNMTALTPDATLTAIAKKRAAQLMLHTDESETLPNGDALTTLIPGVGDTEITAYNRYYNDVTQSNIESELSALRYNYAEGQAIGIAVFKVADINALYIIASSRPSASAYTDFTNANYTYSDKLLTSNVAQGYVNANQPDGKNYYNLTYKVMASGYYREYIKVANSQVTYKSSKPKVFKIKGTKGYSKQSGKFNLKAYTKGGALISSQEMSVTVYGTAPYINSLKSTKRKSFTIKWTNYISNAGGYQIQYSTDKKFKKNTKTVTVKGKYKSAKTISKLKSKKRYYVRIRFYVNQGDGEKMYGDWSKKKSVVIR